MKFPHYSELLRAQLESRCAANARYSLRAFARDLGISASRLSQILQCKQGLSDRTASVIAKKLWSNSAEASRFCTLVAAADSRSKSQREEALAKLETDSSAQEPSNTLQIDTFRVISDWYHYALMELTLLPRFKNDLSWIARKLGISRIEAQEAIARLKRLELLEERKGKLVCTEGFLSTTSGIPSEAIQKFNRQILEKATQAITLQSVAERDLSTLTIAISSDDFVEYQALIKDFRRKLNEFAMRRAKDSPKKIDSVYALAIQFFRLSEKDSDA